MSDQKQDAGAQMTPREVKQLYKLLEKFARLPYNNETDDPRIAAMVRTVGQWVKWYANEVLSEDL